MSRCLTSVIISNDSDVKGYLAARSPSSLETIKKKQRQSIHFTNCHSSSIIQNTSQPENYWVSIGWIFIFCVEWNVLTLLWRPPASLWLCKRQWCPEFPYWLLLSTCSRRREIKSKCQISKFCWRRLKRLVNVGLTGCWTPGLCLHVWVFRPKRDHASLCCWLGTVWGWRLYRRLSWEPQYHWENKPPPPDWTSWRHHWV